MSLNSETLSCFRANSLLVDMSLNSETLSSFRANSLLVDMSLNSETLSCFRGNSLCFCSLILYLLQRSIKNQLYSLWFDPIRTQTSQSTALKSSMLTIQRIKKEILSKRISETLMNLKEKKNQTFL